jgi:predicted nucleic acid-binding protein
VGQRWVKALLDTNILIATGSPSEPVPNLDGFDDLLVSTLSWSEMTRGVHAAKSITVFRARHRILQALQATFGAGLPYDDTCLPAYDTVMGRVADRDGDIRANLTDRMLAATAITYDLALVTRNVDDFRSFDDLLDVVEQ